MTLRLISASASAGLGPQAARTVGRTDNQTGAGHFPKAAASSLIDRSARRGGPCDRDRDRDTQSRHLAVTRTRRAGSSQRGAHLRSHHHDHRRWPPGAEAAGDSDTRSCRAAQVCSPVRDAGPGLLAVMRALTEHPFFVESIFFSVDARPAVQVGLSGDRRRHCQWQPRRRWPRPQSSQPEAAARRARGSRASAASGAFEH